MDQSKLRQLTGVQRNATLRKQFTKNQIEYAITYLQKHNIPVTVFEIVKLTGYSKATVYRYREFIGKENIRSYTKFSSAVTDDN